MKVGRWKYTDVGVGGRGGGGMGYGGGGGGGVQRNSDQPDEKCNIYSIFLCKSYKQWCRDDHMHVILLGNRNMSF